MTTDPKAATPWLAKSRADSRTRLRLFCFPYAGGTSLVYRRWGEALPPWVEVCAVQLPGRGPRIAERPYASLPDLVEALLPVVAERGDLPFAFFGHSMGAAIAFELAHRLRLTLQVEPRHLFVSARRAPHLPHRGRMLHDLPDAEFKEELRDLNGTPPEVLEHPELMQMMIPLLRADFSVSETYRCERRPLLSCPLTAFGGTHDTHAEPEGVEAWREHTLGPFDLRLFDGDHFFINTRQTQLLSAVAGALAASARGFHN